MSEYVLNLWYMAAWEEEVDGDALLSRRLLDKSWVIFRQADGSFAMLRDRCPHRFVALSMGRREGDTIRCAYHGLGFDGSGACVHNPFGDPLPSNARVPSLPIVARHSALWFWPGDPASADPALIPDFSFMATADHNRGRYLFPVDYRLIVDNLMDLSHAEFIHTNTFGTNGGLLDFGAQRVEQADDGSISNNWDIRGAEPPFFVKERLPADARIDQDIHITWYAPASLALSIGMRNGEQPHDPIMPAMLNPHILTPETIASSHYFFTDGHHSGAREMTEAVFLGEDEPIVAAAQAGMEGRDFWDNDPLILRTDAAAIRVRRRMKKLLREEHRATEARSATPAVPQWQM